MRILFLHGAPASGKRTIGDAIARLTSGRLLDNHAAIDFARTVLDFDAPGFWALVHAVRMAALEYAAANGVPLVIYTSCYSHPDDLVLVEDIERILNRHGGELLPAFVACPRSTLEERVGAPDRVERRKVTSIAGLNRCLATWNLVPVPRDNNLTIDSGQLSVDEAARAVATHFQLL